MLNGEREGKKMNLRNPWFDWMSFLVGLALSCAVWIAVRDCWRGERDVWEAVSVGHDLCCVGDWGVLDFIAVGAKTEADARMAVG
jgi:hypothetical protein